MVTDRMKELNASNWDHPDPFMKHFVCLPPDSQVPKAVSGDEWARIVLATKLSDQVPVEVRRLFAVAQSALAYGCFFYPLFTLGTEQLTRVGETAIRYKCIACEIPVATARWDRSLGALLNDLSNKQHLFNDEKMWWVSLQRLRNESSHPTEQSVLAPGVAIDLMRAVAGAIIRLFDAKP